MAVVVVVDMVVVHEEGTIQILPTEIATKIDLLTMGMPPTFEYLA